MTFYHRISEERWKQIQEDGELFGISCGLDGWDKVNKDRVNRMRYTYLSPDDWGESYGTVLLVVEYEPKREDFGKKHNYGFDPPPGQHCIQFSVFEPIPLSQVKRVN